MRKLTIIFHDAGGGHRSAAEALKTSLEREHSPWEIELLNIQELLDSIDLVRKATGLRIQESYNLILRKGWTRCTPQLLVGLRGLIRAFHRPILRTLEKYWMQHPTDLVLSVIPHFNRAIAESIQRRIPMAPFVTLLTDFADYPPHFWIERESEYLICGTERAKQQALSSGHPSRNVFQASGMILKPSFYRKPEIDPVREKTQLGLDPSVPTGIVMFGGYGSSSMADIAARLDEISDELQLILICGRNQKLQQELTDRATRKKMLIVGFTRSVDYYMSLADFFIGKPGPGSISEALQFHLPVIVECNSCTLPQERYNANWVTDKRVGLVLRSFRDIGQAVHQLLAPATFAQFRSNAEAYSNRALFEVPEILDRVFEQHAPYSMPISTTLPGIFGQGAAWAGST